MENREICLQIQCDHSTPKQLSNSGLYSSGLIRMFFFASTPASLSTTDVLRNRLVNARLEETRLVEEIRSGEICPPHIDSFCQCAGSGRICKAHAMDQILGQARIATPETLALSKAHSQPRISRRYPNLLLAMILENTLFSNQNGYLKLVLSPPGLRNCP